MQFSVDPETFHRLPRHPDWRYELWDGAVAHLSHRPQHLRLTRSVAAPLVRGHGTHPEVREPQTDAERDQVVSFLVSVWSREDPYRSFEDPDARAQADITRDVSASALVVLASAATAIEGAVVVTRDDRTSEPMLSSLAVSSRARRTGIATALLDSVLDHLTVVGIPTLRSAVSGANIASLQWHLSRGFTLDPPASSDAG